MSHAWVDSPRLTLDEVLVKIHGISSLPDVAMRVIEVANDPMSGAVELKEVMETDPSLCARVLRCVNSSAYAVRDKITNLQHAIAYLGAKQVRNLALTASVSELFKVDDAIGQYTRMGLWRHMVAVGVCSRMIAMRLNFEYFEDAFLAGMLHDIGIILEDQHVHAGFAEMMQSLDEKKTLVENERDHLGFDHEVLGWKVASEWKMPPSVLAAIRQHHHSDRCRDEHVDLVRVVELANVICTLKGMSSVGVKMTAFCHSAIEGLSIGRDDILVLSQGLDEELAGSAGLFDI